MSKLYLKDKLPKVLQANDFWVEFIEAVEKELLNAKDYIDIAKTIFDVREAKTIDQLRAINQYFGLNVDISLFEDVYDSSPETIIEFLKQESEGIAYKIKQKGTKNYYDYVFNRISEAGNTYMGLIDDNGVIFRSLKWKGETTDIIKLLQAHDFSKPFRQVLPEYPFMDGTIAEDVLDADPVKELDESSPWTLDNELLFNAIQPTNHLMVELVADELYSPNGYLVTPRHLDYLLRSVNFGRKTTEVPHAGVQINCLGTGDDSQTNLIADNQVETSVTTYFVGNSRSPITDLYYRFEVGDGSGSNWYFTRRISENEIDYEGGRDIEAVHFSVPAWTIFPDVILTGYASETTVSGTLSQTPILPNTFRIQYTENESNDERLIVDDGQGNLFFTDINYVAISTVDGDYAGTIDYTTGAYTFSFATGMPSPEDTQYPINGEKLEAKYKTASNPTIQEMRILDASDNVVVNTTFPPVVFSEANNHVSFLVAIRND